MEQNRRDEHDTLTSKLGRVERDNYLEATHIILLVIAIGNVFIGHVSVSAFTAGRGVFVARHNP